MSAKHYIEIKVDISKNAQFSSESLLVFDTKMKIISGSEIPDKDKIKLEIADCLDFFNNLSGSRIALLVNGYQTVFERA